MRHATTGPATVAFSFQPIDLACGRYTITSARITFVSPPALRVLESMQQITKRIDVQGMAEQIGIGFPLADRTPYADIRVLEAGQDLVCENGHVRCSRYFHWDAIPPTQLTVDQLLDQAYEVFRAAVARRSADQPDAVATLSGGLDSRCIVTALHTLRKEIYALTWYAPGYVDGKLAQNCQVHGPKTGAAPRSGGPKLERLLRLLPRSYVAGDIEPLAARSGVLRRWGNCGRRLRLPDAPTRGLDAVRASGSRD